MIPELEAVLERAIEMFFEGKSLKRIRAYIKSEVPSVTLALRQKVADRLGITLDEFTFKTGDSFNKTRFQRPRHTYSLVENAVIGAFAAIRRDYAKVRKQLRINSTVGGVRVTKKLYDAVNAQPSRTSQLEILDEGLRDWTTRALRIRVLARATNITSLYLTTEYVHARNRIIHQGMLFDGFKFMYIPKTAHGHLDECRAYEGRYWAIDSGVPLPPYHPRCAHTVTYLKKLPKNQRISNPVNIPKNDLPPTR